MPGGPIGFFLLMIKLAVPVRGSLFVCHVAFIFIVTVLTLTAAVGRRRVVVVALIATAGTCTAGLTRVPMDLGCV